MNNMPAWQIFTVYGPLGIIFGLAVIFTRAAFQKLVADRDAERQYSMEVEKDLRDKIVPLLGQVQDALTQTVVVLKDVQTDIKVRDEVERRRGA